MKIMALGLTRWLAEAIEFVSEGILELFSSTDNYPAVGLQPYGGEISSDWVER